MRHLLTLSLVIALFAGIVVADDRPVRTDLTPKDLTRVEKVTALTTDFTKPEQFDVLVTENLYGDIVSDLCAGLVGGLGLAPGANIGEHGAVFEAVHGSAPDIAGKGLANPTALLFSALMMLRHIGENDKATKIGRAVLKVLSEGQTVTGDLGGKATTKEYTDAIIRQICQA